MNSTDITYQQYGPNSVLLSWPPKINNDILKNIISIKELLFENEKEQLQDIVNGYSTLLLIYHEAFKYSQKERYLKKIIAISRNQNNKFLNTKHWTIPVCYHESFGFDLELFSQIKNLDKQDVIDIHTSSKYQIYCKGFLPGFMYLGGLNSKLSIPRKSKPRLRIPKNSVAIGGEQTGIYPSESPGGWYIIGRTPITLFDIIRKPLSDITIGDTIKFKEITLVDYLALKSRKINLHDYYEE